MSAFDQLHPALQHHIVNSLGWRDLRPFQEAVIPSVLAGDHLVILAPTAGGKTEAAFFPVLSRMLTENWAGLSVLYVCPIKALLNNLDVRLRRYCSLVGRRSALWHGDVLTSTRRRIRDDPPDCLLTTPESIEVMLVSGHVDHRRLFRNVRAVIVDEIHAFADDDRGWHLLAVLERVSRLSEHEIQRLGLSATVGNPETLCDWLAGSCEGNRRVSAPSEIGLAEADVKVDFVGKLSNAASVIARLHRGEKRLVFLDSRARAEELGSELKKLDVTTFVTHSSLSKDERHRAEEAFASREDCVIVATSVLELGIDVGDLDRVIQIDAPPTVAGFLQRMGRTGRRPGTTRNCLFLTTSEDALLHAAALARLWEKGLVEPVIPPPLPFHVLAQQIMALALQEHGIGRDDWKRSIGKMPGFASLPEGEIEQVIQHMINGDILWEDDGILWFGRKGEGEFGRRNFMELLSMITSEPLFAVRYGQVDLGFVHEVSFSIRREEPIVLLLGGRSWKVNHLDWKHKIAFVEPVRGEGRSRWIGSGQPLSFEVAQTIQGVLADKAPDETWSRRASQRISDLREQMPWIRPDGSILVRTPDTLTWWTFAGGLANASLAEVIRQRLHVRVLSDDLALEIDPSCRPQDIDSLRQMDPAAFPVPISDDLRASLKFSTCLSDALVRHLLAGRLRDPGSLAQILSQPIASISL